MSVRELGDAAGVSPSTIVRLCHKVGCRGYKDFRSGILVEVVTKDRSAVASLSGVEKGDCTETILQKVTDRNISSLSLTVRLLDPVSVEAVVSLMGSSSCIALFGAGASLLVAKDLQLKLLRIGLPCLCCDDLHSQRVYAQNTTSSDLAIVISYSGTTPGIVGCARTAKDNGTKVVAITCGAFDSSLARISDYVLGVAATELLVRSGAMSSRIAQLNVVDVLFASYVASNYERCMRLLTSNRIIKPCNSDGGRSLSRKAAPDD
jgi:DNA-binding MurR/RpiR family transcriptional regulator